MNKLAFCSAMLFALGAFGSHDAYASLIFETPGNDNVILDTTTGYSWLAAPVTLGDSPDQALSANPGYQLADLSQVVTLLDDAGITPADVNTGAYYASDEAAQNSFSQLFQLTDFWVQYYGPEAAGWEYLGYGNVLDSAGTGWDREDLDVRNSPLGTDGASSTYVRLGDCLACSSSIDFDFLVNTTAAADTPEPATGVLLSLSLVVACLLRRRRA